VFFFFFFQAQSTNRIFFYSSHWAPRFLEVDTEKSIKTCVHTIQNFLNYLLLHGVCPEYTQDIVCAKVVCAKAEKELWAIHQLRSLLTGPFNTACSTLYGSLQHNFGGTPWSLTEEEIPAQEIELWGMSDKEAQCIVKTAFALLGKKEMLRGVAANNIRVVKEESHSFEVVEIIRADAKVQDAFGEAKDFNGKRGGMQPLGIMRVKHFDNPDLLDEDCSEDGTGDAVGNDTTEDFWVEDDVLEVCFVGLKMEVEVHELNIGIKYLDTINKLYCSFLTVLPQVLMDNWKEPEENPRPAPTVDKPGNPEDEEGADMDV